MTTRMKHVSLFNVNPKIRARTSQLKSRDYH